jgi:putative ABC transport system permease protein
MLILLSLYRLNTQDTGFAADQVLAVSLAYNVNMDDEPQQFSIDIRNFGNQLLDEVQAIPGVDAAALLGGRALLQESYYNPPSEILQIEGWNDADGQVTGNVATASENYFAVMDILLLAGRVFTADDVQDSLRVVLVNEKLADRYFPGGDAIGRRIKLPWEETWATIVGVVGSVRSRSLNQVENEVVYYNFQQRPGDVMNLYVKSSADLGVLGARVADIIHEVGPRQSVGSVTPLVDIKSEWLAPTTLRAMLTSAFGLLALVVTLSGVIGVLTYNINQRVHEIGIHIAIGANPGNIQRMFIVQVLQIYLLGLVLGCVAMAFAAPLLEPVLYQTRALDAAVYLASLMLLTVSVLSAMYLPTRKASGLHPAAALHMQ